MYTVNAANLIALVIQIIEWTISFVPILLLNKKINSQKFPNLPSPWKFLEIFPKISGNISENFWKYFRKFPKISGNISENFQKFLEIFPSRRTLK